MAHNSWTERLYKLFRGTTTHTQEGVNIGMANGPHMDAFHRLRVSQPTTLFDSTLQYDTQPFLWVTKEVGTASVTHVPLHSAADLTIGTAAGDRAVRQTLEYIPYQPGKSQAIKATAVWAAAQAGTNQYVLYGDDKNGVGFLYNEEGWHTLLRSSTTGTVSDARTVAQADWNQDAMDGSGPSGLNLERIHSPLMYIDLEWLSVGEVRLAIFANGRPNYVHIYSQLDAGVLPGAYMTTANLPIRYEIVNTTDVASSSTLKQICCEVEAEGGEQETLAYPFEAYVEQFPVPSGAAARTIVFATRVASTFNGIECRGLFRPIGFEGVATNTTINASILYNPTLTGTPTWGPIDGAGSFMEGSTDIGTNFSGGTPIGGALIPAGGKNKTGDNIKGSLSSRMPYGRDIDGNNPTVLALAVHGIGGAAVGDFKFFWKERR